MAFPIAPIGEVVGSLFGALRLARGDAGGMAFFNTSHEGFWRSFTAAILIAPMFIMLLSVRYVVSEAGVPVMRFAAVEAVAYVISWLAFPLLLFHLTDILGIGERFIRYIVAYNWASVLQNLIYMPFALLVEAGVMHGAGSSFIGMILLGIVLVYIWFVTRTALEVSSFLAAGLVMIDLTLSIFINSISQGMLRVT